MKTYLFDFDGTLVDSMPSWSSVMTRILDKYNITYPPNIINIITPLGTLGTANYYIRLGVPLSVEEIVNLMGEYMLDEYFYHIPAKEHVIDTLTTLKSCGHSLNILTASPHITLDACLKRLGIWELFSNVWSSDDFNTTKSNPEIYKKVAEELSIAPNDLLFLDDNINACKTAKEAGVTVCGVYDKTSEECIDKIKEISDFYIYDFKDLPHLNF